MGEEPWQIAFDDMKIPVENLVGKEGEGSNWRRSGSASAG